ncbi:MAG: DUF2892 domain-containing protein [Bacteroidota bacterium]
MKRFLRGLSYTFHRNLGRTDRILRAVAALVLAGLWFLGWVPGVIGIVLAVFGLMVLGTALSARCSINYWCDLNTMTAAEKAQLDQRGVQYE